MRYNEAIKKLTELHCDFSIVHYTWQGADGCNVVLVNMSNKAAVKLCISLRRKWNREDGYLCY